MAKFTRDIVKNQVTCYVSDSVLRETETKVEEIGTFLGDSLKQLIAYRFEEERRNTGIGQSAPLTSSDIGIMERMFIDVRGQQYARPLTAHYQALEVWILNALETAVSKPTTMNPSQLVTQMVSWALQYAAQIRDSLDRNVRIKSELARLFNVSADQSVVEDLMAIGVEPSDALHIASASSRVPQEFDKVVFVTLDYQTIINKQEAILKAARIICTDPLYATFHLLE